jgi:RNA polymerase sigma-70 factor (ECF subfamily)
LALDVESLYRKYGPMVIRRCRALLRNEEMAIDAAQDTFVKLLRYEKKLCQSAPSSLLYRIATNVCLNLLRKEKRAPVQDDEEIIAQVAHVSRHEEQFAVREILHSIFREERASTGEIAVLYYVDGMTYEEVAAEVGLSVSGVRKRLRTLTRKLKEKKEVFL